MKIRNVLLLLLSFALLISCGKKEEDAIKIGAILPLTGDASDYGIKSKNGIDLALEEINKQGGVNGQQIKIIYEDDRLEPKEGLNAFNKLSNVDNVPCIIGPISSGVVLTIAPETNKKKIVILSTYASNYKITEAGDYIFRIYPSDALQGKTDSEFADSMGWKDGAILYINSDYGVGLKNVFKKRFQELGNKILIEEGFNQGDTDFRSQLEKIKRSHTSFIFMPGNAKEMALILVQAKQLGIKQKFIATDSFLESTVSEIAGNAAQGVYYSVPLENHDSTYQNFVKRFNAKYKINPGLLEALGYDGMKILALAISKGGYSSEGIKNALYSISGYKGATGDITFDKNGDILKNFILKHVAEQR